MRKTRAQWVVTWRNVDGSDGRYTTDNGLIASEYARLTRLDRNVDPQSVHLLARVTFRDR